MKATKAPKTARKAAKAPSSVVREFPPIGLTPTVSVRTAKAQLSALLDLVTVGREFVITSDGRPKARLVPMSGGRPKPVFTGTREHLAKMPKWKGGPTADEIVRADRDARGW